MSIDNKEKISLLISYFEEKGFEKQTIANSFTPLLLHDEVCDKMFDFMKEHPKASKDEVWYQIFHFYLNSRGIDY